MIWLPSLQIGEDEPMKQLYTTQVFIKGGRDGKARSDDGLLDVPLAFPKLLGGSGNGTNPEQLFAAGFGACFTSSLGAASRTLKIVPTSITVTASVTLTVDEQGAYGIDALLEPVLEGISRDEAERLVSEASRICAYSNALKGKAKVELRLP